MNMPVPVKFKYSRNPIAAKLQLFVLMLLFVLISACASGRPDAAEKESMLRKGVESNTSLGLEYMNRGQYEVALGKLKKAVKDDPGYAPAQTVIAVLYERIGETGLAGKHYQMAYEADPKDGDVNNNYGVYLCQTGEGNRAIKHFHTALDDPFYSTPSIALTNAGSCELGRRNMAEADTYLRRALKIEPELPDALIIMARLNFEEQNFLKSRAFMQRYESVASHRASSLLLAYRIETASGDRKTASQYKIILETNFPDSTQTAEVRRISGK